MKRLVPALLCCAFPLCTHAANAAAPSTARLPIADETIVVTAHRIWMPDPILPGVASDPADAPIVGMDALRDLPSFAISQSGSLGSVTQVRVRGSEANHLLVLVDGMEVMDPAADAGFNFANLNLAGVSRVEFLPGAQSAIWGSHALAGVLQLSTVPNRQIRRLQVESGSFDTASVNLQLADRTDDYYYNLSASDFSTDGTNMSRRGNETDRYENRAWFASAGVDRENWSLRGLSRRVRTNSDFDQPAWPDYVPVDSDSAASRTETLNGVTLDLRGNEVAWQQRISLSRLETRATTTENDVRSEATDGQRLLASAVTELPLTERQTLVALLEYREEDFEQSGPASEWGDPNQQQKIDSKSYGLEYILRATDQLQFSLGGRADRNSDFDDSRSYRIAASYQWRDDTRLWAAYGTGIKQPSFIERFGYMANSFIGNNDLQAEENLHASIGVLHQRGAWQHRFTLYRDELKDEINGFYFDAAAGGYTAVNEDGDSRRHGIEWSSDYVWASGQLRAGASWLDANDPDGSPEIRRPEWQAFTSLQQEWRRWRFDLGAAYVADQDDFDFATYPATRVTLDDYVLAHAVISREIGANTRVSVRGANLLDEHYEDVYGYAAPGRAWYLDLRFDL